MVNHKVVTLAALFALGSVAPMAFADDTSVTVDRPGVGMHEIKKGDKVPDEYKRKELAVGDWKKRHLAAPGENEQWVKIQDRYVLVNIPNGTAKDLVAPHAPMKK